jgi:enamine deaminase RidA (YjgF/YER057c/UK114 family)
MSTRKLISTGSAFEVTMGYSRAVIQGDWAFVSGVTGYDYSTMKMPENIADQARNCFETIKSALKEGGFELSDIARVQYTVTNPALVEALIPAFGEYMSNVRPAATMIVAGLIKPEMLIEIEATAFKG